MTRLATLTALVLSVAGAAFGAYATMRESTVLDRYPLRSYREFHRIASGSADYGLSSFSKARYLEQCYLILTSSGYAIRPEQHRRMFAEQCRTKAAAITTSMPTNSFAWLVSAVASAELKDMPSMNSALLASHRSAPHEQWIVEKRVSLAEDNFASLDAQVRTANDADLALLAVSYRGVRSIASRYIEDEAFRERITAIVSTLSNEVQRRFVWSVKQAAQEVTQ
jgi:hypothetical protein